MQAGCMGGSGGVPGSPSPAAAAGSPHLTQNLLFPMSGVPRSGTSPRNMNVPTGGSKGQSGFDAAKVQLGAWQHGGCVLLLHRRRTFHSHLR